MKVFTYKIDEELEELIKKLKKKPYTRIGKTIYLHEDILNLKEKMK